ncbi:MAG: hypothetical protein K0Q85_1203 [Caproiciproducens sp.]|nr:hypothetical protein [Caproiciproducens sp.]
MDEYELGRLLVNISYKNWITKELFSLGWFVILGVMLSVYAVWLKLLDKSRVKDILLFGSLSSIGFMLADVIFGSYLGFSSHGIDIFPFKPSFFIVSITVTPVLFMLIYQYTSSWRSYTMWIIICTAALSFGLAPLYMNLGILEYHKGWNHFFTFLRSVTDGMIARAIVLWFTSIEQSQPASSRVAQRLFDVQPAAAKPLDNDENDKTDDSQ